LIKNNLTQNQNRVFYIDVLKTIAIFAVILIHISGSSFYLYSTINIKSWLVSDIVDSFCRWGVPVLLMASGAMLLNRERLDERPSEFFKKRLRKVLIPFLFWSLIYFLWVQRNSLDQINLHVLLEGVKTFLQGGVYYHLYFLYYLLGLYIVIPIIRVFLKSATRKDLNYFLILWFIGNAAYPSISQYFGINIGVPIYIVTGFVGYYIIGFYITNYEIRKIFKWIVYALGIIGLLGIAIGTYILTKRSGIPDESLYSYLSPFVIFSSVAVMLFVKSVKWEKIINNKNKTVSIITEISAASFGVYLIHPIILEMLSKYGINSSYIHPLIGTGVTFILVFLISFLIISLIRRIPIFKKIV